jgi:hypothetical protein
MSEVVVATAIVGVMTVAALESLNMVYRTRRLNGSRLTAPCLAQDLLAEVLAMPYEDPQIAGGSIGLDSGETASSRATYDDVDDYNGFTSTGVKARNGTAIADYNSWQQQVQVVYVLTTNPATTSGTDTGLKRITVTATSPEGKVATAVALRTRRGSLDQPQGVTDDAVTWLGATLKVGNGARGERMGAAPTNPAADVN